MHDVFSDAGSIRLSRWMVLAFAALLVVLDVTGPWFVDFICRNVALHTGAQFAVPLLICLYSCSLPGYLVLYDLYRLLQNLEASRVFTEDNVKRMRRVSWCCLAVSLFCLAASVVWASLLVVALAAALMGLIVRIVKNVFVRAIRMKDELDLTI